MKPKTLTSSEVIDEFGGTAKVASICNITSGAVSQWRTSGIPAARLMFLELLRPDVFGLEEKQVKRKAK